MFLFQFCQFVFFDGDRSINGWRENYSKSSLNGPITNRIPALNTCIEFTEIAKDYYLLVMLCLVWYSSLNQERFITILIKILIARFLFASNLASGSIYNRNNYSMRLFINHFNQLCWCDIILIVTLSLSWRPYGYC